MIALSHADEEGAIIPNQSTVTQAGDIVTVLELKKTLRRLKQLQQRKRKANRKIRLAFSNDYLPGFCFKKCCKSDNCLFRLISFYG